MTLSRGIAVSHPLQKEATPALVRLAGAASTVAWKFQASVEMQEMSTSFDVKLLQIPRRLYEEMLTQARAELPNECCGLLAGRDGRVTHRYPLTNALASPTRYESDPMAMLAADKDMRKEGSDLLAIYHSHPASEPVPSRTDLESNFYGSEVVHIIISLREAAPEVRGWHLHPDSYGEAAWEVAD
jgi:proteasome lid subunit RPN8/RPN11